MTDIQTTTFGFSESKTKCRIPTFFASNRVFKNGWFINQRDRKETHYGSSLAEIDKTKPDWTWDVTLNEAAQFISKLIPFGAQILNSFSPIKMLSREDYGGGEEAARKRMALEIRKQMKEQGVDKIAIFDPGMNQSWRDAAWRASILGYALRRRAEDFDFMRGFAGEFVGVENIKDPKDLGFIPVFFSWPAVGGGEEPEYLGDGESNEASQPAYFRFMRWLADEFGASNIMVVSHSMGGRLDNSAMKNWQPKDDSDRFMARMEIAADQDFDVFEENYLKSVIRSTQPNRVLLFGSDGDSLMRLSAAVHMGLRKDFAWFVRWIQGVESKLTPDQIRELERVRVGQVSKLPRTEGVKAVDYTKADNFGIGHAVPYWVIRDFALAMAAGTEKDFGTSGSYCKLNRPEFIDTIVVDETFYEERMLDKQSDDTSTHH